MAKKALYTVTRSADTFGKSAPGPEPLPNAHWELERVDFVERPLSDRIILHTYVLVSDVLPVVVRATTADGKDVAILRVGPEGQATCLPMTGGPFLLAGITELEVGPGIDAEDVQTLFR